jgi:hypothetical protein
LIGWLNCQAYSYRKKIPTVKIIGSLNAVAEAGKVAGKILGDQIDVNMSEMWLRLGLYQR